MQHNTHMGNENEIGSSRMKMKAGDISLPPEARHFIFQMRAMLLPCLQRKHCKCAPHVLSLQQEPGSSDVWPHVQLMKVSQRLAQRSLPAPFHCTSRLKRHYAASML